MVLMMSQPKSYASATYSSTTSSSPTTAFTAFVGDGDSGGNSNSNSNSNNTYTYNRKRGNLRSEHQPTAHEHGRNAPGPPKAAIPVGINNINHNNHHNFHYHQKGRQQSATTWSMVKGGTGGEAYHGPAEDIIDDDIDGEEEQEEEEEEEEEDDDDDDEQVELYGTVDKISEDGRVAAFGARRQHRQQFGVMQSKGAFDSEYFYGNGGSSIKHRANHTDDLERERALELDMDQDRPHGQSQARIHPSRVNDSNWSRGSRGSSSGFGGTSSHAASYEIPPTSKFAKPTTTTTGSTSRYASSHAGASTTSYTHPNQDNHAYTYNRQLQSRHTTRYQHRHHPSASVSHAGYSSRSDSHGRRYNPPRQRQRPQQPPPSHTYPRTASSLAFYNTAKAHPPSSPPPSSPPLSPSSLTRRASKASPPSAPPRVSSLLPPPRSTVASTNTSPRPPLSTGTSASASRATVIAAPILPEELALPGNDSHPNTNSRPLPASTATATPPSSNALVQEAPTHAQSAISFLDSLNTTAGAVPDAPSVLASGAGSAPGPGSASRPPAHSRANSFGTAGGSLRNLNRWSSSTASSHLSTWDYHDYQQQQARQQKSTASARRMSVDSIGLVPQRPDTNQESRPANYASPRKLSRRQPSQGTSTSPTTRARARSGSASGLVAGGGATATTRWDSSPPPLPPSSSVPPPNLPPIISLPPLDTDPGSSFRLGSPRAMGRASPGLSTPNSVFASQQAYADPADYFWSDLSNPARTASPAMRANTTLLPPAPVTRDRDVVPERRGHSRSRSAARGGSGDSTKPKDRSSSKPSQKAMLSKALSMANTAVQLDNAQNYGAAREAYVEACELLQQVLARTNGEDDRNKLEAIRRTYTSRIEELDGLVPANPHGDKALPARPDSFDYHGVQMELARIDSQSDAATITRSHRDGSPNSQVSSQVMRRPSDFTTYSDFSRSADIDLGRHQSSFSRSPMRRNFEGGALTIPHPPDDNFLPAPLSPRRPISPARVPSPEPIVRQDFSLTSQRERLTVASEFRSHRRNLSHESASWLDPIDESGGSTTSSVHSRSSSRIMRKHIRQPSGNTEAEFDAALDAAVEAAYDDGYEPMEPSAMTYDEIDDDRIATSMRRVEQAKELVRQTEREAAIEMARERERQRQMSLGQQSQTYGGDFFDANDSDEEEERMLEEMTRGYVMEDFALSQQSRYQSSVPRESNSSGFTSRTWHSSMGSNPPTGTTTLSAVSERTSSGNLRKASSPPMPPPAHSLPQPPLNRPSSTTGVRNRRLSGQNTKQLKIETSKLGPPPMPPPPINTSSAAQSQPTSSYIAQQRQALSAISTRPGPFSMRAPSSPVRGISPADAAGPASPPGGQDDEVRTGSPPSTRPGMRKNFSTSSLKSLKSRQISLSHIDDADPLPMTPISQQLSNSSVSRLPTMPALPTPIVTTFPDKIGGGIGGLYLFDSDFHSPVAQSPNSTHHHHQNSDIPIPLEPCPSDPMFRPFWLMRAVYQTLAHPRGGYISNRLFVPQDAWKVKGVKLRNIEDKISQCDLLTAALQKLARVDSTDADAMLDEMQNFENILEAAQATLSRRLGTEVGTQGMITFKDEKESEVPPVPRNNSISGKGGAFSWRRLRSKGSAVNLASTYGIKTNANGAGPTGVSGIPEKDVISPGGSMPSLPMVAHPSSRPAKRDVTSVKFDGPNANYMASLARLFDAAQTVDQIARQVDDPGLRHADKTQVGLELCTRHAAEFFGFYICRFVLTDLGMLLDKFVKRGTEWVLN
ncbi:hypothetical protein F5B21DRAFT_60306 [Xylaria acuta]|nr:hypothetical protein F5B21DRAFT_60306 [Xylaria acuta]